METNFLIPSAALLIALVFALACGVIWLVYLIDAVKRPDLEWVQADQSKVVYVLLMVFLGLLGTIIYVLAARPALQRAAQDG